MMLKGTGNSLFGFPSSHFLSFETKRHLLKNHRRPPPRRPPLHRLDVDLLLVETVLFQRNLKALLHCSKISDFSRIHGHPFVFSSGIGSQIRDSSIETSDIWECSSGAYSKTRSLVTRAAADSNSEGETVKFQSPTRLSSLRLCLVSGIAVVFGLWYFQNIE